MLNWIAWNRSGFICIKIDLALIANNGWYAIKPNQTNFFKQKLRPMHEDVRFMGDSESWSNKLL